MKSQMNMRKFLATAVVASLSFSAFIPSTVNAQRSPVSVIAESRPELEVKFLGTSGEYLNFELTMNQADDSRSQLRVRNGEGNEIYSENVSRKATIRTLKISKENIEKLEFTYSTLKGEVKKAYEISIKFLEAVEVKAVAKL